MVANAMAANAHMATLATEQMGVLLQVLVFALASLL